MKPRTGRSAIQMLSICFVLVATLAGCATSLRDRFEDVHTGMEKGEVLDIMGSPQRRQRWKGMDRWSYVEIEDHKRFIGEVHFDEGYAVYRGDPIKPKISAEEQDRLNAASNLAVERRWEQQRKNAQRGLERYEEEYRGRDDDEDNTVPQFKAIP